MIKMCEDRKVIFFCGFKFTERDYQRFGVAVLQRNGFTTEVWDGSAIIYPEAQAGKVFLPGENDSIIDKTFFRIEDLENSITTCHKNTIIICLFSLNTNTLPIFRLLSNNNLNWGVDNTNSLPVPKMYYSASTKYRHYLSRLFKDKLLTSIQALINKIILKYYFLFGVKPAIYVLMSGTRSTDFMNTPIDGRTQRIKMHSMDYDIYLEEREIPEETDEKLCVFIDTYSTTDPDRFYHGEGSTYYPTEAYYRNINRFFDHLENRFGYRIIILSHPKMRPVEDHKIFGNRERIYGKTPHYVKKATCVLSHESTAISFAILFKKPILFLTSHEIEQMPNGRNINTLAELLGKKPIYIDNSFPSKLADLKGVDSYLYNTYVSSYITQTPNDIPSWQIFSDYFLQKVKTCQNT
jgi:hypothetical protein